MFFANTHSFDWDHLRYFLAVAREGSLAAAARALGVNHSTVFRRIQSFEDDLGARLFDRLPEGYALTAAGGEILRHAEEVDEAVASLSRTAAGKDFRLSGDIRLTTAMSLAREFVSPALRTFARQHPGIRVEVAVSDSDYDLNRREADLALRATSHPPEHLVGRRVATVPWFLFGATRGPRPRNWAQAKKHPIIGADAGLQRLPAFRWLHAELPRTQFAATANNLDTMAALARAGLGFALLPADETGPGLARLFRIDPPFDSQLWLLTHPDLRHVARIKAFSDHLYAHMQADKRLRPFR